MTRLMFSADHHFDESKRWQECQRIHGWMVAKAAELQVDAFISCGDVYERASTPTERQAVANWLQQMAEVCPVYVVKGNHDKVLDCALMSRLSARHPITVCESFAVEYINDVAVAMMAWPSRAGVLQFAQERGLNADVSAQAALEALLRGISVQWGEHRGPRILAGHASVDGALTSTGQPLIGTPMNVALGDLDLAAAHMVVLGHIHKPQDWAMPSGHPVIYTGSPFRTAYGETEDKSVLVVDSDEQGALTWRRLQTPCSQMHLINTTWSDGAFVPPLHVDHVPGSEVRIRYTVDTDARDAARAAAQQVAENDLASAADVQIEEVVQTTAETRAPEVAKAQTIGDKLCVLWDTRGEVPEQKRRTRLLELAASLEEQTA